MARPQLPNAMNETPAPSPSLPLELHELFATLAEYQAAVPRQKEPNPPDLLAIYSRLDALEKQVKPVADEMLQHYLYKKSYRKAWLYLQGLPSD